MLRQRKQGNGSEATKATATTTPEKSATGVKTNSDGLFWIQAVTTAVILSMVRAMAVLLMREDNSFEAAMSTYGFYHQHPINKVIHFFGIPLIVWSAFLLLAHVPLPFAGSTFSFSTAVFALYTVFYLALDIIGGILFFPVLGAMYWSSVRWNGKPGVISFALILQALSWYVQIHPGHLVLEGGKPALWDGLGEALTVAPMFAFYEGLWAVGINPELQRRADRAVHSLSLQKCAAHPGITYICDSLHQEAN